MRKEWEWRVSRGESLRNLEAFRSILARPGDPGPALTSPPDRGVRLGWLGWRHDGTHAHPAASRRVRLEPEEPLHRVGRRRPHREGPRRGGARWPADGGCRAAPRRRAHLGAAPRDHHGQPRARRVSTGTGSRCGAAGGSTSGTTARSRASTRRPPATSTATSSSCSGAAASTPRRRRSKSGSEFDQTGDPRYAGVDVPLTECLKDVIPRMMPYWENDIQADLTAGHTVLVTAHGNSLRALVKHLDGISDDDIAGPEHPDRACRSSTGSVTTSCRPARASTSTRRPRPPRPPRSPTRAADLRPSAHPRPQVARVAAAEQLLPRAEPLAAPVPRDEPVDARPAARRPPRARRCPRAARSTSEAG